MQLYPAAPLAYHFFFRIIVLFEERFLISSPFFFAAFRDLRMAGQPWESTLTSEISNSKILAFLQAYSSGLAKKAELEFASAAFPEKNSLPTLAFLQVWN